MKTRTLLKVLLTALAGLLCFLLVSCVSLGIPPRDNVIEPVDLSVVSDGTYRGVGKVTPPFGTPAVFRKIRVTVTVSGGTIREVYIENGQAVRETMTETVRRILAENRPDVDAQTGATWSGRALGIAVSRALRQGQTAGE